MSTQEKTKDTPTKGLKPNGLAEAYLHRSAGIIFCETWDRILKFKNNWYQKLGPKELASDLLNFLKKDGHDCSSLTSHFLKEVSYFVEILAPKHTDFELAHNYFAFNDGLYNTDTHEITPHSPDNSNILGFKYIDCNIVDFNNSMPNFENYLKTSLVSKYDFNQTDPELIDLLQEACGSLFTIHEGGRQAFFFSGPTASGKSTLTEFIIYAFGEKLVSSATLKQLTSRFGTAVLVGKIANICSEESSKIFDDNKWKAMISGEQIQGERKNEPPFEFHPYAKFISTTNEMPQFTNLDKAMKRRLQLIPFYRTRESVKERDTQLKYKLREEKAPIIGWMLEGLKRLQKNNYVFTKAGASLEEMAGLEEDSSSVIRFIRENYIFDPSKVNKISSGILFNEYKVWCQNNNYKAKATVWFGRNISSLQDCVKSETRKHGGSVYHLRKREGMDDVEDTLDPDKEVLNQNFNY